jgi:GNAT superfamily N-acetyltransferase
MRIRQFNNTDKDISAVTYLINQFDNLPAEITKKEIVEVINETDFDKSMIFIAEENGACLGYCFATEVLFLGMGKYIELQSIIVDKNHRNTGIGKKLIGECELWCRKKGYKKIVLASRVQLINAHEFYKSMGYEINRQSFYFQKYL